MHKLHNAYALNLGSFACTEVKKNIYTHLTMHVAYRYICRTQSGIAN